MAKGVANEDLAKEGEGVSLKRWFSRRCVCWVNE